MASFKKPLSIALASAIAVSLGTPAITVKAAAPKYVKPNVIYWMSDDLTAQAVNAVGGRFKSVFPNLTPNLDRLANEGAVLPNTFCNNAICVPSRATIVTGQYSHKNGVYGLEDVLNPASNTYIKMAHDTGYTTSMFGKWHLQSEPQGLDYYSIMPGQGSYASYGADASGNMHTNDVAEYVESDKGPIWPKYEPDRIYEDINVQPYPRTGIVFTKPGEHSTDVTMDKAISWLKNRDTSKPFMTMIQEKAPHVPNSGYNVKYENDIGGVNPNAVNLPLPNSLFEDRSHRDIASRYLGLQGSGAKIDETKPFDQFKPFTAEEKATITAAYNKEVKGYLRLVKGVDDNIGKLLAYLDTTNDPRNPGKKLKDTTVLICTSDQGINLYDHDQSDKRWIFNESGAIPMIVRYPAEVAAKSVVKDMITTLDFAPTILDYCGISKTPEMQGRSFRENLRGQTPSDWSQVSYYRYWSSGEALAPAHYAVRTPEYLYIQYYGLLATGLRVAPALKDQVPDKWTPVGAELYDLRNDSHENNNVYYTPGYQDVVKRMQSIMTAKRQEVGDTDAKTPEVTTRVNKFLSGQPEVIGDIPANKIFVYFGTTSQSKLFNTKDEAVYSTGMAAITADNQRRLNEANTYTSNLKAKQALVTTEDIDQSRQNMAFYIKLRSALMGQTSLTGDDLAYADYDRTGGLNAADALTIRSNLMGN